MSESKPRVLAVCVSPGGIPKIPVDRAVVGEEGLAGDGRDHEKHRKPSRAVLIQDEELLSELRADGYEVSWGSLGENLTVRDLHVQRMEAGRRLRFSGGLELELTEPRRPCYVLDAIDPKLKEVVVGRCGFMTRVVKPGVIRPGETIEAVDPPGGEE
ncbi:MAG: MOSC domain-containing protein [Candidatus Eisenbacteria bacterium]